MSHGQGGEGKTAIYSIIFFPSQSPFIDFKDKATGSALKMDEKLSTPEMDTLTILPFELISFPYIIFVLYDWKIIPLLTEMSLSLKSLRYNLFQMNLT